MKVKRKIVKRNIKFLLLIDFQRIFRLYQNAGRNIILILIDIAYDNAIHRRFEDIQIIAHLVLDVIEDGIALTAKVGEYILIVLITHLCTRRLHAILIFILELMQCWEVVSSQWLCAGTTRNARMTLAMTRTLVTFRLPGTTDITVTIFATE